LTDEEVITMETCGEYFKLGCDKDIFAYFYAHYRHFFPKLIERSTASGQFVASQSRNPKTFGTGQWTNSRPCSGH
jgi:hypothetical protein